MPIFFIKFKELLNRRPLFLTWFIVILVCLVLVISYYSFFRPSLVSIGHRITTLHLEIAANAKNQIENLVTENTNALAQLAQSLAIVDDDEKKRIIVNNFIKEKYWFEEISVLDRFGREYLKASQYVSYHPSEYQNLFNYEQFQEAIKGNLYLSRVYTSAKAVPYITVSLPIKQSSGGITGVISAELSLRKIWSIVSDIEVGNVGQVYLVDSLGYLIAHRDVSLVLRKTNVSNRQAVSRLLSEKRSILGLGDSEDYTNEQGEKVYVVGLPLLELGWGVFAEEPIADAWASYRKIRTSGLILGIMTLILLLILMANARVLNILFMDLRKGRQLLSGEVERRTQELRELDRTTKLLVKRDLELSLTNQELDKKIEELEKSEKSLLRAFSDIRSTQIKLKEEKDKTEAIIANFIDPIIVLDKDRRISLFNPASERIFGLKSGDLGQVVDDKDNFSFLNFKSLIRKNFTAKPIAEAESSGWNLEEVEVDHGQHTTTYKVITAQVLSDQGEYLGVMKIFYDITREKILDRLKSEFISIAAHQLRTPLSAIKWVIKMVLDEDVGKLNKEQHDLLDKGYKSNERIIRLVNDLLNVSRIEEGRFGYNFEKNDFRETINAVVEGVAGLIAKNHIKFVVNKPKNMPLVLFDKEKMLLVLQNLVDNAIKYTPEYGKIEINLSIEGKFFRVAVKDNGVGIPDKDKMKLFSKFFRAANVVRMQTEGSGLGLFITKNIIEKHGGSITVDSREGQGTEISFKIPLTA